VKPFLLLATRAEDAIAEAERAAFLRFGRLADESLRSIRMEAAPLPPLDLDEYSGVIVGGSPFNASDSEKSPVQLRVEREMSELLDEVVARDFPFFGACYGIGTLGAHQGGVIDRQYGESIGAVEVAVTEAGRADAIFGELPPTFNAFVGHKEGCSALPANAVLLASSATCPVQAFRIKQNLYATQFHPELTVDDLIGRIMAYRFEGYFEPAEMAATIARVRAAPRVSWPARILRSFITRYSAD
jgi:GMP synthase (glutamine-hydrolysing)